MAEVILKDARGCWTRHTVAPGDQHTALAFIRAGLIWRRLLFVREKYERGGLPVYSSAQPAIGSASKPFHPLFLPMGWSYPW